MDLNSFCFLCLKHNNNVLSLPHIGSTAKEILEYVIPNHMLEKFQIQKNICVGCLNNINNIFKFRQQCRENVTTFNEYVQTLSDKYGSNEYLSVPLSAILRQRKCELPTYDENNKIQVKNENTDTEICNSVTENQSEDIGKDDTIVEQVLIKCEPASDEYEGQEEINEEINIKDNSQELCPYNADTHSVANEKTDEQILGYDIPSNFMYDYQSTSDFNRLNPLRHTSVNTSHSLYSCDTCQEAFNEPSLLESHKLVHIGSVYTCDLCQKTFTELTKFTQHKRVHTSSRRFICDVCQKTFRRSCDLNKHKRIHSGERPYQCDVCQKTFTEMGNLNQHKKIHNGGLKPYPCDVCKKLFGRAADLKKHQRIHTGERPYVCEVCQKAFNQSIALIYHRRIHTNEKPFSCDVCGKRFNHSCSMISHKRIHTGERPYSCEVCQKRFRQCGAMKKHLLTHSNGKAERTRVKKESAS